jgi:hypothetical protein
VHSSGSEAILELCSSNVMLDSPKAGLSANDIAGSGPCALIPSPEAGEVALFAWSPDGVLDRLNASPYPR